jgi:NADH-quinone oxidoreductase subunit E
MAFSLSPEQEKTVDELIARYPTRMAACIPVLHLCQEERGWVSPDVIDYVAGRLDMSTSQVQGVVTFYTMYHQREVAPNVVWVCRTLSCDLRGAKTIQEHLEHRLGCHAGETSRDGKVTLLKAECLAACGNAPMIQLNDEFREDLDVAKVDAILDELGVAPLAAGLRHPVRGAPLRAAPFRAAPFRAVELPEDDGPSARDSEPGDKTFRTETFDANEAASRGEEEE